jgi:energy-coupling factor transporter ATP-binding protein EcfA2
MLLRFTASLLSKRFLILTGLAGSGKTKLAQAFAHWLTPDPGPLDPSEPSKGKNPNPFFALVPVGADWTGNENILGYPDGLRPPTVAAGAANNDGAYITKPALDLITHALTHKDVPHLLILDEMNLSHVERYFADMLSMIESQMSITLYCDDKGPDGRSKKTRGIDPILTLSPNLFIIGTVNVDETTYMFSPKVLDRANVIEFRVTPEEMGAFLGSPTAPDLDQLDGKGLPFAPQFVTAAAQKPNSLVTDEKKRYTAEMSLFFAILREHGAEFGYRVAHEAARFLHYYRLLSQAECWQEKEDGPPVVAAGCAPEDAKNRDWFDHAFDAVIIQKFLPKLHGSKVKLGPLLRKVYTACLEPHADTPRDFKATAATLNDPKAAAQLKEPAHDIPKDARYPVTAEKVSRMWRQLNENGFTSFPEN